MIYRQAKDEKFSLMSLGTVQLGLQYGLNKTEKPSRDEGIEVLRKSWDGKINTIDTAAAYGDSEEVIGEWLCRDQVNPILVTKIHQLDHSTAKTVRDSMRQQIKASAERLKVNTVPIVMIHHYDEFDADRKNVLDAFGAMKDEGLIRYSGASAYASHDYHGIAESGLDAIQIPVNLFDWRRIDDGGMRQLQESGMIVFARSVYLQGLALRTEENLPEKMTFCRDIIRKKEQIRAKWDMSSMELALSFAITVPGITSLVLGCRNTQQVFGNLDQISRLRVLTDSEMSEIRDLFYDTDERILTPMLW